MHNVNVRHGAALQPREGALSRRRVNKQPPREKKKVEKNRISGKNNRGGGGASGRRGKGACVVGMCRWEVHARTRTTRSATSRLHAELREDGKVAEIVVSIIILKGRIEDAL